MPALPSCMLHAACSMQKVSFCILGNRLFFVRSYMDNLIIKAFRMRLKRFGFTDISITRVNPHYEIYHLSCIDPRGFKFDLDTTPTLMAFEPQIVFFNRYKFPF